MTTPPPRLAFVGDRSPSVQAHARIPRLVEALGIGAGDPVELYWLPSAAVSNAADVTGFDGIWVVPGSPYEHRDGVLAAIQAARVNGIPFLGTCGGFQHLLLEFARNVCGLSGADNAEERPDASPLLIVPLECSLLGEEAAVVVQAGTLAAALMGEGPAVERFFCRYGLDERYLEELVGHGLVVSGRDVTGAVRLIELPDHPFFLGSLFQPELSSDETWVHPLIGGFIAAVRAHASRTGRPAGLLERAR
jgi:CTP synthase (UTP-ammonia lyase)